MHTLRTRLARPPLLILILTILGYGLFLPYTGFYWDDWPFAWIAKFLGPAEFIPAFVPFRPFLGPIFLATTHLIPPVPLYWQIFALLIRYLMGLGVWWMFGQIWPDKPRLTLTLALLLTIFPGYSQHWVAYTHINQELIPFLFFILSFGFTFKALRCGRPFAYTALALLLQICGIFPTEYFFGMEGLRGLFLFMRAPGDFPARLGRTLKSWWPYLLVWILNAFWLIYYYRYGPYRSYEVTAAEDVGRLNFFPELADTLWKTCFYIWGQILQLVAANPFSPSALLSLAVVAVTIILLIFTSALHQETGQDRDFAAWLIAIGLIGVLLGRLPSLAAGLPLRLQSSYDRFMISMMLGGILFIVGLVEWTFRNPRHAGTVLSVLIALGAGQQVFNANIFRRDWDQQQQIYWQLAWRIPALKPGTLLLTDQMPIDYETDLSLTAPLNWMYAPDFKPPHLPYALLYTEKRIGGPTLPSFAPGTSISFPYRTVTFDGSTSQVIVIHMPFHGCLRVLDPARGDAEVYAKLPAVLTDAIPLSSPSNIITSPARAAAPTFLSDEPEHTWCYYFTKAELAYQGKDFEKVISLYEEAARRGFSPEDGNESLIFIEAYAYSRRLDQAASLTDKLIALDGRMRRAACATWKRIAGQSAAENPGQVQRILSGLNCSK